MEFDADVQCTNYAGLLTSLPTVEEVLDDHASELGHDLLAYRNHVCRGVRGHSDRLTPAFTTSISYLLSISSYVRSR